MLSIAAFGEIFKPACSSEIFAPIPGFSKYSVSDHGCVSGPAGIMADYDSGKGYRQIILRDDIGRRRHVYVHRLVLMAHHGLPPYPTAQAAHWNGNRADNRIENLRWATPTQNAADRRRHAADKARVAQSVH